MKLKEQFEKEKFTENSNIFGFIIVLILYFLFSILSGSLNDQAFYANYGVFDWIVFCVYPLITAIIGTLAKSFLKKQGVRHGFQNEIVKCVSDELELLKCNDDKETIPDSYEVFFVKSTLKDGILSFLFSVAISVLTSLMVIDFSWNNLANTLICLSLWVALGIRDYTNMYDYVIHKHIINMRYEIKQIKEKEKWQ